MARTVNGEGKKGWSECASYWPVWGRCSQSRCIRGIVKEGELKVCWDEGEEPVVGREVMLDFLGYLA